MTKTSNLFQSGGHRIPHKSRHFRQWPQQARLEPRAGLGWKSSCRRNSTHTGPGDENGRNEGEKIKQGQGEKIRRKWSSNPQKIQPELKTKGKGGLVCSSHNLWRGCWLPIEWDISCFGRVEKRDKKTNGSFAKGHRWPQN